MLDAKNQIIYVGKAKNIKNRVKSYFSSSASIRVQKLIEDTTKIEYIITESEVDALLLECSMIKRHKPHFNVALLDDKSYPFIKITTYDEFPKLEYTRKRSDQGKYFGPYPNATHAKKTYKLIQKLFKIRTCSKNTFLKKRGCLNYHIGMCLAPCIQKTSKEEYKVAADNAVSFLEGASEKVLEDLREKMNDASKKLDFEKAGKIRDQIFAIEDVTTVKRLDVSQIDDADVVAYAQNEDTLAITLIFVRAQSLLRKSEFVFNISSIIDPKDAFFDFLLQYYHTKEKIPPKILLQSEIEDLEILEAAISKKKALKITIAATDEEQRLVSMGVKNSSFYVLKKSRENISKSIKEELKLDREPNRIEGIDISNLGSSFAVGSVVVFEKGAPRKNQYRQFKIKDVFSQNDVKMIEEVVTRRYSSLLKDKKRLPDLILIDGGVAQLNAAAVALQNLSISHIPLFSLAKKEEKIFSKKTKEPIVLSLHSPTLAYLQYIRDEAHRFAVKYHDTLRKRAFITSELDEIKGVGNVSKKKLLSAFTSIEDIKNSTEDEIHQRANVPLSLAKRIIEYLRTPTTTHEK